MSDTPPASPAHLNAEELAELGGQLYADVLTGVDLPTLFSDFGGHYMVAKPVLRVPPGQALAFATAAGIERMRALAEPVVFTPSSGTVGVEVVFIGIPVGEMNPVARSNTVAAMVELLVERLGGVLAELFSYCVCCGRLAGPDAIRAATGAAEVSAATLPTGVDVLYAASALTFGYLASTHRQYLSDGETESDQPEWHLRVTVEYCAALFLDSARRLFAVGPGPK